MSNFTKFTGSPAFWQSVMNLTCCYIDKHKRKVKSIGALGFFMLFMFFGNSLYAQDASLQRSVVLNLCVDDRPGPLQTQASLEALFGGDCGDEPLTYEVEEELSEGADDCGWQVIYSYYIKCGDYTNIYKEIYVGRDQSPPELVGTIDPGESGINGCKDEAPLGPDEGTVAGWFDDNCGPIIVRKSGEVTGDDCEWTATYTYSVQDGCENAYLGEVVVTYTGGDQEPPFLKKKVAIPTGTKGLNLCYDMDLLPEGPSEEEIAALFNDNCADITAENVTKSMASKGTDCGWKLTYTYKIEDDCDNFADDILVVYTGSDQSPPVLSGVPEDIEVDCIDQIPAPAQVTADDNCAGKLKVKLVEDDSELGDACTGGILKRTWSAKDGCGLDVSATQTITVKPTPPATFDDAEPISITCEELDGYVFPGLGYSNGVEEGACAVSGIAEPLFEPFQGDCGEFIINYSAEVCGETITADRLVEVYDNKLPTIDKAAEDKTVECDGAGNEADLQAWLESNGGAMASDNCDTDLTWTYEPFQLSDECGGTGSAEVIFVVTDNCGNSSKTSAIFTIKDETPPTWDKLPEDLVVECDGSGNVADIQAWLANYGGAEASDICSSPVTIMHYNGFEISDDCGATGSAEVTFIATDDCDNKAYIKANIIIQDTTPPKIDGGGDKVVECDGAGNGDDLNAWLESNAGADASDECSGVKWSNDFDALSDDCGATGTATVTFTATDDCGLSSSFKATFTIVDTQSPPITTEAQDYEAKCDGQGNEDEYETWLANNGGAVASDICSDITWRSRELSTTEGCGLTKTIEVEFTVTDACGLSSATKASFIIIDENAPEFELEAQDKTVECDGAGNTADLEAWLASNGGALAYDECSDEPLKWTYSPNPAVLSDECGATGSVTVEFTVEDNCGNSNKTSATFTVEDTTPPLFDFVPDNVLDLECGIDKLPEPNATAFDECGDVTVSYKDYDTVTPWLNLSLPNINYQATDDGFIGSASADLGVAEIASAAVTKAGTLSFDIDYQEGEGSSADLAIVLNGEFYEFFLDSTAETVTIEGLQAGDVVILSAFSFFAGEIGLTVSNTSFEADEVECPIKECYIRLFTATDDCGNEGYAFQQLAFVDTLAPQAPKAPEDITVECDDERLSAEYPYWPETSLTAFDDCDGDIKGDEKQEIVRYELCDSRYDIVRTWTFTDACGLQSSVTQTITVEDTTPPTFTRPIDAIIYSDENCEYNASPDITGDVKDEEDNCSDELNAEYEDSDPMPGSCEGEVIIKRTWTLVDECGNEAEPQVQTITVKDNIPPTFTAPKDIEILCTDSTDISNTGDVIDEDDNCTKELEAVALPDVIIPGNCAGNYTIERTWTLVDDCGNEAEPQTQIITVVDKEAPVKVTDIPPYFNEINDCKPEDALAYGLSEEELENQDPNAGTVYFTDNCSAVEVTKEVKSMGGDDCSWIITFTYTVADDCGNVYGSFKVSYIGGDDTAPVFEGDPTGILAGSDDGVCIEDVPPAPPAEMVASLYSDNCAEKVSAHRLDDTVVRNGCAWSVTYNYAIKDDCDNYADNVTITHTGEDDVPPVLDPKFFNKYPTHVNGLDYCEGVDLVEEGIEPSEEQILEYFYENCDGPVTIIKEVIFDSADDDIDDTCGPNGWNRVINIRAVDACGNESDNFKLIFQGFDMSGPELGNCEEDPMPIYTSQGFDCPETGVIELNDGDELDTEGLFTVAGQNLKEFNPELYIPLCFYDNCTAKEDLKYVVSTVDKELVDSCYAILTLGFRAVDACGNESPDEFFCVFNLIDDTAPVVSIPGVEECGDTVDLGELTEDDLGEDGWPLAIPTKAMYEDDCQGSGFTSSYEDISATSSISQSLSTITFSCFISDAPFDIVFEANGDGTFADGVLYDADGLVENPIEEYVLEYDEQNGAWEVNVLSGIPLWVNISDNEYPSCDVEDWSDNNTNCPIDAVECDYDTFEEWTLTREFYKELCGKTGKCSATYTWTIGEAPCLADAGTLTSNHPNGVVLNSPFVDISATPNGDAVVPEGYTGLFVLTSGEGLLIEQTSDSPSFMVDEIGLYTIHTLVIETAVLEGLTLPEGATGFTVLGLIEELGLCADLDAAGAPVQVFPILFDEADSARVDFKAYPVPFRDNVNISYDFGYDTDVTIEVFNARGMLVKSITNDKYTRGSKGVTNLNLGRSAASQMYYVKITTAKGTMTKKIISGN